MIGERRFEKKEVQLVIKKAWQWIYKIVWKRIPFDI